DGVGGAHAALVVGLAALERELAGLLAIEITEGFDDGVTLTSLVRAQVLEQAAAHDLEALLGRRGAPVLFHAAEDVLELGQRETTTLAADFDVRRGDGGDDQGFRYGARRVGEGLREGGLRVERASG